jgi:signal recognition particle GTPase
VTLPLRGTPRRTLLVAADMLAPAAFRQLRLWALWGRVTRGGRA